MKPGYITQLPDGMRATRVPGPDEPTIGEVVHTRPQTPVGGTPMNTKPLSEPILPDDYPIYAGYCYVADCRVIVSDWHDITARQFKNAEGITELRRCDMAGRGLL
jgi:hypothetical protein